MSALDEIGLSIPVMSTVVAPKSRFAASIAHVLKVLVPQCEKATTISFRETKYLELTKS
jgi:hypothetical protein